MSAVWDKDSDRRRITPFFYDSRNLDRVVCAEDLKGLDAESLDVLEKELDTVVGHIQASYEWAEISQPTEWPDEDWPKRVSSALAFHKRLLRQVRKAKEPEYHLKVLIAQKEADRQREITYQKKKEYLEQKRLKEQEKEQKHMEHQERLAKIGYLRTKHIYSLLKDRYGEAVADEIYEEAQALAHSNVDSATWKE